MSNFIFNELSIRGLYLIEPKVIGDERGYFMETYQADDFKSAGLSMNFVQNNESFSEKGVLRGLHFQKTHPQGKLVRAIKGEIYDVAVDIRESSPTFLQWYGVKLSEVNKKMLYVPKGLAHGFLVLSDEALFSYQCTDFYHPEDEGGILWNDPMIGVEWPLEKGETPIVSDKDKILPTYKESQFKFAMYKNEIQ